MEQNKSQKSQLELRRKIQRKEKRFFIRLIGAIPEEKERTMVEQTRASMLNYNNSTVIQLSLWNSVWIPLLNNSIPSSADTHKRKWFEAFQDLIF